MANTLMLSERPRVLVVGGGYVGLYVAKALEKKVRAAGGVVTVVDPLPYMTYQPFLPEVIGGHIESRHALVSHRMHLRETELITGKVVSVDHDRKVAVIRDPDRHYFEIPYRDIVMSAGATTRTFPIEGLVDHGIGLKTIEEAVTVRNKILERLETASIMEESPAKRRALTFTVVGGGFAGIEAVAEMEDLIRVAVKATPRLQQSDVRIVLIEAAPRIMPEITEKQAEQTVEDLRARGIEVLLNTSLDSCVDGHMKLISMKDKSIVDEFESDTLLWTAGVEASKVAKRTPFPIDARGRIMAEPTLQVSDGAGGVIEGAWTAGDIAAVPDLTGGGVGGYCVPNAQHAVRQAKLLAKNLLAARYGKGHIQQYKHKSLGAVAGLGMFQGVGTPMGIELSGFLAWMAHRGYHGMAMPTVERKLRVLSGWVNELVLGRDFAQLKDLITPYRQFQEAAGKRSKESLEEQKRFEAAAAAQKALLEKEHAKEEAQK